MSAAAAIRPLGWLPGVAALLLAVMIGFVAGVAPGIAVFLALAVGFTLLTLTNLTAGLLVLVLVVFAEATPFAGPALSLTKLTGLLLALAWVARLASRPAGQDPLLFSSHPVLSFALAAFVGWAAISAIWAKAPSTALTDASAFLLVATLYVIVYTAVANRSQATWVLAAVIGAAAFTAAYGLVLRPEGGSENITRLTSTIRDPNVLAATLVVGTALSVAALFALRGRPVARLASGATLALCLAAFLLTGSRGGVVAFAVALVVAVVVAGRWRVRMATIAALFGLAVLLYFSLYAPPEIRERIGAATSGEIEQEEGRFTIWAVAWRVVEDNPVRGVGAGNFEDVSTQYVFEPGTIYRTDRVIDNPTVAHNTYLQVLADLGIIGLSLFLAIIVFSVACALAAARAFGEHGDWRMEVMARGTVVAMAGVLAANFFVSEESGKVMWLLLALGPALLGVARASIDESSATESERPHTAPRTDPLSARP